MGTVQRERRYICGQSRDKAEYQEVEIYTVSTDKKGRAREREKTRPPRFSGKEKQPWDDHNAKRSRVWFSRLLATNFTEKDTHTTLTYSDPLLPADDEQAARDVTNFLRHVRTKCRAQGIPDPEAIIVTESQEANPETGTRAVRYHHHVVMKCGLSRDEIESCWHRKGVFLGNANADRLRTDKGSLEALASYLLKYPKRKHRWRRTKGIKDPIMPRPNDSKYTRRGIERICKDSALLNSPDYWGKKYPGWRVHEAIPEYNEFWGWSITLKMHRLPQQKRGPNNEH